jgi:DNA (cytosine-5)-methyltransferase 1
VGTAWRNTSLKYGIYHHPSQGRTCRSCRRYSARAAWPRGWTVENDAYRAVATTLYTYSKMKRPTVLELCAGAGGQALGFEEAGFEHVALVEIDADARATLLVNRPNWNVVEGEQTNIHKFDARRYAGTDVVAAGLPCPPFSKAGKQLGKKDDRNLFPPALRIIREAKPRAVVIENVRGLLDAVFEDYREFISGELADLGYWTDWKLLNASEFGVAQLRPRVVFVAIRSDLQSQFSWPECNPGKPPTVGERLIDLMQANGWRGAKQWKKCACEIAPTIVGGSKKHGGPDLGPTRAKRAWASLGVNAHLIAKDAPAKTFVGMPHLTVRMVARLQGFPDHWQFVGAKTSAYRQVGNAFPPPVAKAVATSIASCLQQRARVSSIAG